MCQVLCCNTRCLDRNNIRSTNLVSCSVLVLKMHFVNSAVRCKFVVSDQDEEVYTSKMQQQREELAQLTAERQKLLQMQEQLYRLQDTLLQTSQVYVVAYQERIML
jgi:hypothetical protein